MKKTQTAPGGLLESMALRYDHSLVIASPVFKNGHFDVEKEEELLERKKDIINKMREIYSVIPDLPLSQKPDKEMLLIMADKYNELFYEEVNDLKSRISEERIKESTLTTMMQLYEEVSGFGFYKYK